MPVSQRKSVFTLVKGAAHVGLPVSQHKYVFTLAKGAAHAALSNKQRKCAFTLAEVLVTLGIIGVVAAMTLSTVISKIQDKQNIAKWKKEYSVISNAFNEVVADGIAVCQTNNSGGSCYGQGYTDEFVDALQKN